ncbi:RICIN domain-containing protein [Streptomyces ficellus]|uniref:RICIN domain-containing protein n=1 Tax=Streptomyces ficellus TaxID=1977088 RepID=A0ABT7Z0Q6_9ACTN|nr:RICIN domain-containing protein [Streptomyces ficellus]MDN3293050.1 RICIN domain-containing protein [Streptomyces ficellus]
MSSFRTDRPVPPPPPYAPTSGGADAALARMLSAPGGAGDAYPGTVLMARHWRAAADYAALLTASRTHASMAVAAAFERVLEELREGVGPEEAVRPRLLVAVRRAVADWAADPRLVALLSSVRDPAGPAPDRQLAARAFAALPGTAQVLLWHREVEAEGISIPAALLAIDPRAATEQLERARELFRDGCVRAHSELAADPECRHYNRLLDISLRRGTALIPDIQRHLAKCRHCRYAADQLRHFRGRLPVLLAEGVLGEGARGYLDSRPGRRRTRTQAGARGMGRHSRAARARVARGLSVPSRGALLVGLGVVMTGVLAVAAVSSLWSQDDSAGPGTGTAAPSGPVPSGSTSSGPVTVAPPVVPSDAVSSAAPAPGSRPTTAGPPASAGYGDTTGPLTTRLRNAEAGLCLDIRDGRPSVGAELTLAPCSASATQQWRYEADGLLHSAAAPVLCPNSQEHAGVVVLRLCAAQDAASVRYDLSVQGHITPRWHAGLALMPATADPGTSVVVKLRDGSASQRWLTDSAPGSPEPRRAEEVESAGSRPAPTPPPPATGHEARPEGSDARPGVRSVNDPATPEPDQGRRGPAQEAVSLVAGLVPVPVPVSVPVPAPGLAR